ncbi:potassium channel-like protein [Xylona heveae TC161]|uniref:Potassium channel-like protein n=1 Tax=Xylona heveae (strain CBS 132557 / TC161) TaxID=1328760 RepID=A0A165AH17_XYLHT|nr:potassium channel-like protein [Xylona heveae TC161]KZF20458.1 potassium channel-like protein [Xylona heveae TC161]
MNDPGLDSPIQDGAREVESEKKEKASEENEEGSFLDPSRWWFFSTAFPLIAGTFGPMASAFNLCALVESWRVYIPPGGSEIHGQTIADPKWLIAINAVSFVFAIIANIALLLNMARRLRFSIAQPVTIIGWYIASVLLIALVSAASDDLRLHPAAQHAFTQPFYYAIMSAALYFLISSLMVATVYGAWRGHYAKEFRLTMSQRTLMLQTISYLFYLLIGAAIYARIESWTFLDSVYWAECTLLTVGSGDYTPVTHVGRSLLFPYAIGGIVILGLTIGSIRALILERGKEKLAARMVEKHRVHLVSSMDKQRRSMMPNIVMPKRISLEGLSEHDRREKEFQLMRTVQARAMHTRRWASLFISSFAWFTLWTVGAAIFFKTERDQSWSYFESLYYAYTSLLTIGYGDFYPQSNSGKPFFVFWSMLAIPTMTILISNMGDTVIKIIRDVTLWIGDITILPSDKRSLRNLTRSFTKSASGDLEEAPGLLGTLKRRASGTQAHRHNSNSTTGANRVVDEATKQMEREELTDEEKARERGDKPAENAHHRHYLLIKEIRKVMKHLNDSPPKKFSFEEWSRYLKLIGEDENSPAAHRRPQAHPAKGAHEGPDLQQAQTMDDKGHVKPWSWLDDRSPLMGTKPEAEWLVERMTSLLEESILEHYHRHEKGDEH